MSDDGVDLDDRETVHHGFLTVERLHMRFRRFDGAWSATVRRELLKRGQAVAVLPYDPDADRVVLIEQYRVGPWAAGLGGWIVELVAGLIEDDASPEVVGRREAREEAGLTLRTLHPAHRYLTSPGVSSELLWLFIGTVDASKVGGLHGVAHEHEDIRAFTCGRAEAWDLVEDGRIIDASTLLALHWLDRNRARLVGG